MFRMTTVESTSIHTVTGSTLSSIAFTVKVEALRARIIVTEHEAVLVSGSCAHINFLT